MALPTQFAYRSTGSVKLMSYPTIEDIREIDENVRTVQYSKDGNYFGWATNECVKIINADTGALVSEISKKNVIDIGFSPKRTYLSTWERPVKLEGDVPHKNLIIWDVATGNELISFTQKSQNKWNVQWTSDEAYFCRMVTNEVHFYDNARLSKGIHSKLRLENISDFALSPGRSPAIAAFIPEKRGSPAVVRIYSITNFNNALAHKTFFKADKIQMKWNVLGTNLLVLTQTDIDKTNKSYYGETNLYFLSVAGNYDCRVDLDKKGPIHDVTWSPNSKEFIVIYGFMPSKVTLFDHRANPVHEFGINPRNTAQFNPQGRHILIIVQHSSFHIIGLLNSIVPLQSTSLLIYIAGFGNLSGTVDVWDRQTLKKLNTFEAPDTSECTWSPDGRHIMTATLSPRLRVENGYKIWHYSGSLMHMKSVEELWQVVWRPASVELYPMRTTLSPPPKPIGDGTQSTVKPPPKPVGAYRPPHARGTATPQMFKREDETPSGSQLDSSKAQKPAATGETSPSKVATKNKKKREASKKKREEREEPGQSVTNSNAPSTGAANQVTVTPAGAQTETEKKIKTITKKLRQITELKERLARGDQLEQTQIQKISSEATLIKELEQLKIQS
ncbi:2317_t:CDS:10 [Paraglomus brasilianum]|uniref:Eukaryotic translation initiation factor 2A n=1 Tax=Paraglomus brasilianum TaxID=144538 RepID=A0A9N8ZHI5_9GLOM|nr:2317_t:CDS:10 [Paraglomus brasilianum]